MSALVLSRYRWLALLVTYFLLISLLPAALLAQEPPPPSPTEYERHDAEATPEVAANGNETQLAPAADTGEPLLEAEIAGEDTAAPLIQLDPATAVAEPIRLAGVQGVVTLDVSTPDTINAGEFITYTYRYQNTGQSTATGIMIDAIWTNYSTNVNGNWQWCDPTLCDILSQEGPLVTKAAPFSGTGFNARYQVGDLAPGASGQFSVRLDSRRDLYPQTNKSITRPAGSGKLYLNGSTATTISDDTANTMVVGPVLTLKKTVDNTLKLYPTESAEFVITLGNATGTGDSAGGQIRADARTATNVVLKDTFPADGDFVSATGNPVVDATAKTVTWTIPGPLQPGQSLEFRVTFRKLDAKADCKYLNNNTYKVTSDEYPLNGAARYTVAGVGAAVPIVVPMVIKSVIATPAAAVYGSESTITIVVQNFWNQPLSGVQLNYDVQSNAYYVPGTAVPTPSVAPDGVSLGGRVSWIFDIGAGNKTTATETTFSLRVRGDFSKNVILGVAQLIVPSGVPSACITTRIGRVNLTPRLNLTKYTNADISTKVNNYYVVDRGQDFTYIIDVTNSATTDALAVTINDALPNQSGASFSYVPGSATLNGAPREPDTFTDGPTGVIIWNNVVVPAGGTIQLRYRLKVDGYDYVEYCNVATAASGSEAIEYKGGNKICVKINPQITVTKTVDRSTAKPDEEVRFTLTLINYEAIAYRVGLYDYLGEFQFVRQESGYAEPQLGNRTLTWPLIDLGPGQQVTAVIVVKTPNVCTTRTYVNEVFFQNPNGIVIPIPRVKASVTVTCGTNIIEFSKAQDRPLISLRDRIVYTVSIKNANTTAAISSVTVKDILPPGFIYVGLDAGSEIKTAPVQETRASDGRVKLTWTIPSIEKNVTTRIKYIARSGDIVGLPENWVTATAPNLLEARCIGNCRTVVEDGESIQYEVEQVSVQPLITMAPEITDASCARPGDVRVYRLSILNTNNHDYKDTTVSVTLPLGLRFSRALGTTTTPSISTTSFGISTMTWNYLVIPAKPANAFAAQVVLEVELKIGQVWGQLDTLVQTTSPDGLIPRKDGVLDPTILVCPEGPAIAKDVGYPFVGSGGEVVYQISLANPTDSSFTISVEDQLPPEMSYVSAVTGPAPLGPAPSANGNTLTWTNVQVPAMADGKAGLVLLQFKVRVFGTTGTIYRNTVTVPSSSAPITEAAFTGVDILVANRTFLPLVRR